MLKAFGYIERVVRDLLYIICAQHILRYHLIEVPWFKIRVGIKINEGPQKAERSQWFKITVVATHDHGRSIGMVGTT